jgi:hypothetical protein
MKIGRNTHESAWATHCPASLPDCLASRAVGVPRAYDLQPIYETCCKTDALTLQMHALSDATSTSGAPFRSRPLLHRRDFSQITGARR